MRNLGFFKMYLCEEKLKAGQKLILWGPNSTTKMLKTREELKCIFPLCFLHQPQRFYIKITTTKPSLELGRWENANSWHRKEKQSMKEKNILIACKGRDGSRAFKIFFFNRNIIAVYSYSLQWEMEVVSCPGQCGVYFIYFIGWGWLAHPVCSFSFSM